MSKLLEALEVRKTGKEFSIFDKYVTITEEYKPFSTYEFNRGTEYRIMATFGARAVIHEDDPTKLEYAVDHTKRSIIEAVFGEFRQDIRLISSYIYDRDTEKALAALRDLDRKMFYA